MPVSRPEYATWNADFAEFPARIAPVRGIVGYVFLSFDG